jgi:NAD(P)-dependent dehydrogenase (short-subunit alcohol dehydrogenase family)|tara:strand:- start:746 stop:1588 length:843 start_codon:yes stop_codon:yes gene_type:complete
MRLKDKTAIITGASSGIGKSIAQRFAREGANVVLADIQVDKGKALAAQIGDQALFVETNVASEIAIQNMVEQSITQFGSLDVLVNNAGIRGPDGPIDAANTDQDFENAIAVVYKSVHYGMKHATTAMKKAGKGGSIVNIASIAGQIGGAGTHTYSAMKSAVINLGRVCAAELAASNIRVNAICPGAIATNIYFAWAGLNANEQQLIKLQKALAPVQPIARSGLPEDIANTALFFASEESGFITGQSLTVDGGLSTAVKLEPDTETVQAILADMNLANAAS